MNQTNKRLNGTFLVSFSLLIVFCFNVFCCSGCSKSETTTENKQEDYSWFVHIGAAFGNARCMVVLGATYLSEKRVGEAEYWLL